LAKIVIEGDKHRSERNGLSPRPTQSAGAIGASSNSLKMGGGSRESKRPETSYTAQTRRTLDTNEFVFDNKIRMLCHGRSRTSINEDLEDNEYDGDKIDELEKLHGLNSSDEDFVLECLGCLANLNLKDLDFSRVLTELNLLNWIRETLTTLATSDRRASSAGYKAHLPLPSDLMSNASVLPCFRVHCEDDVILETTRLVGTVCQDCAAAKLVVDADLIPILIQLLNEAPAYLIDLMHDKNNEVRRLCDISLDIISDFDSNWGTRIQADRFRWHNSQWLEMIESANNPTVIGTDPTTEAVIAAALAAASRSRAKCRRGIRKGAGDQDENESEPDEEDSLELRDDSPDFDEPGSGPFGMGLDIDDAAAFLMSLGPHSTRKGSAESDDRMDYMKQLDFLYPAGNVL
uniref:DUF1716 domain-containing protein n=1 Tax=Echinostoma caproni TaxID=27848 RepID=A0A183BCL7_9TREM